MGIKRMLYINIPTMTSTKKCIECKRSYPKTIDNFYKNSKINANGSVQLKAKCKKCYNENAREKRKKTKTKRVYKYRDRRAYTKQYNEKNRDIIRKKNRRAYLIKKQKLGTIKEAEITELNGLIEL